MSIDCICIGDGPMDPRTLDLRALRIFKAVVDETSVTRAAVQLHCVQSNVTTRLRQLEAELGVELFHRIGGRLVITPAGQTLNSYADRLLRLAQEAQRSVQSDGVPRGPLAIGSMETTAAGRLPRLLASFHSLYPEVELTLKTGPTAQLVQDAADFTVDAALVGGAVDHPLLQSRAVFEEELVLITRRDHPAVQSPRDVSDTMLLVFRTGCSYRRRLETWMESQGVAPRRTLEFGTFEAIVACAAAGMGVSLMPRLLLEERRLDDSLRLHPVPPKFGRITTVLVWRKDAASHAARDAFFDVLQAGSTTPACTAAKRRSPSLKRI
jgi:DNA-binding transcriptional LysR family regulator